MDDTEIIEYISKNTDVLLNDKISKMVLDYNEINNETTPSAMTIGGLPEVGINKVSIIEIPEWLLSHPAVERGIDFKFNRLIKLLDKYDISNNIIPANKSKEALEAKEYCANILKNSSNQPLSWIKQFGKDAMRFGDNYLLLVQNKSKTEVLRWELQNPVFFSPSFTSGSGNVDDGYNFLSARSGNVVTYDIDPKTKKPSFYTQLKKQEGNNVLSSSKGIVLIPTGKKFKEDRVVQLNFNKIGDDPFGIPIAQTLWKIVKDIIRVENASTDTMVAFGTNRWIANTQFRTLAKMQEFSKSIENIAKRSTVVLPEGVKLENIKPGSTEFDKVHNILLELIAMCLGISLVQLKGSSADINDSALGELKKDILEDLFADELQLESAINEGFIKSCIIKYKLYGDKLKKFPFPRFSFFEMPEDKDVKAERVLRESLAIRNMWFSINLAMANGFNEYADKMAAYVDQTFLAEKTTQLDFKTKDFDDKLKDEEIKTNKKDIVINEKTQKVETPGKPAITDDSNPSGVSGMSIGAK